MAVETKALSDVFSYAKSQFGDQSGIQISDEDITRATNEACLEIVSKNKVLRASATTDLLANVDEYPKPDDCLQVTGLKYNGTMLKGIGFDAFQELQLDSVSHWTQYGNVIVIGATPTDTETDALKIYYVPKPVLVVSSTDLLPLPDRYFNRICEFVMAKLYELDEDWQAQQINKKAFEQNLADLNYAEEDQSGPFPTVIPYW